MEIKKDNIKKQKINICSSERQIILENGDIFYVLFEIDENGEHFIALTDKKSILFAKIDSKNEELVEVEDEAVIEILLDLLDEFLENVDIVDEKGNDLSKLLLVDQEES
ncbi:hypothetical protein [Metamycoplasma canadense]|uniref:DUF1292 domain-containing protein n=1 Tax=Metamycoplasma canadense TaxID=29554 RepID=A0A077L6F2_9BACT|nr:hypothetical protein [Metamycoplasma canadense]BAP39547.1 hypothetical protein MCAN360_0367 [Metamycoplasma canadense]